MLTPDVYADRFAEVLRRASTRLPRDVVEALRRGRAAEEDGALARTALDTIIANAAMAHAKDAPICQDTGTPVAWIHHPVGTSTRMLRDALEEAVRRTTVLGVKIGVLDRLPACYFVSVTYMCWANRRARARIEEGGELTWLN